MQLNFQAREALAKTAASLQPALWKRDRGSVERIENAQRIEEVLDLVPTATGLAEHAWLKRMRDFGPGATTVIAERLKNLPSPPYPKDRTVIEEKYIEALRWCEDTGIEALLECWDYFDGICLASAHPHEVSHTGAVKSFGGLAGAVRSTVK